MAISEYIHLMAISAYMLMPLMSLITPTMPMILMSMIPLSTSLKQTEEKGRKSSLIAKTLG